MNLGYFETSLDVSDIARSATFYQALGFELIDGNVEVRSMTLQKGDCRLGIYQGHLDPARTQLIFWQGDQAALADEVKARGLGFFKPPASDEGGAAFMLLDPDDHPLFVITLRINFYNQPGHERPVEAKPRTATGTGPDFGRFELSLAVRDFGPSLAFYEKLGFTPVSEAPDRVALLSNADCLIGLYVDGLGPDRARLTFRPTDRAAVVRDLEANGLKLDAGGMLKDPDGHTIRFI